MNTGIKPAETIFSGETHIIPMADVHHIERHWFPDDKIKSRETARGCLVVTKHTKWNFEHDCWENAAYLAHDEMVKFLRAWCDYRSEVDDCDRGPEILKMPKLEPEQE